MKKFAVGILLLSLVVIVPTALAASLHQVSSLPDLLSQFVLLAGVAAFIPAVINVLKFLKVVQDGTADNWSLGLNVLGFALFGGATIFKFDVSHIDAILGAIAPIIMAVLALLGQLATSKISHAVLKGLPLIGTSYSIRAAGK